MKKMILLTFALAFFLSQSVFAVTGRDIIDKSTDLPEADTAMSSVSMEIHKGGKVLTKEFEIMTKKFGEDESKALVSFLKPTKIKLLTHTHKNKEDDQWLRLSSGKVKRITASGKGKSFVNSHFSYEDLSSIDKEDYTYKLLGSETILGEDCFKVESLPKDTNASRVYDKTIIYIRKSDYFALRVDFYVKGKFYKFLENHDIKEIDGIKTPFKIVMALANGKGKTELFAKEVKYNEQIKNNKFNKEALR